MGLGKGLIDLEATIPIHLGTCILVEGGTIKNPKYGSSAPLGENIFILRREVSR